MAPTECLTKHTHDSHDEQTEAEDDERTKTCRNGTTTKTIRLDTIGALRRGCHDAYRTRHERANNEACESNDTTVVENVVATPVDTIRHASQRHFRLGGSIAALRA